ncbi:hypothetical protein [Flammeovirga sp. EKP202]|uniref:hypothetical protein n=1 Tax=Flammeovirga sp. EKP202 TaxID=2770592 RepID=UPI00165FCE6E|nr:hypothetical protein [Flammeovirga sp. EKP202]MBD0401719.1 hypothetical protein [Flammeovirga sp. EKP202]
MTKNFIKHLLFTCISLLSISSYGQNLIPNPSFEDYHEATRGHAHLDNLKEWYNTNQNKPKTLYGTPDHMFINENQPLNGIKDNFSPRTGQSVLGVITYMQRVVNYREYASIKLNKVLRKGEKYQFTAYISSGNKVAYGGIATNGLGFAFTNEKLKQNIYEPLLSASPQYQLEDIFYATGWTKVTFSFVAEEAIKYLTIGNFRDDLQTDLKYINYDIDPQCYIYVDDLSLVHIPSDTPPEEEKVQEPEVVVEKHEIVVDEEPEKVIEEQPKVPETLVYEDRPVENQSSIYITTYSITIQIWDDKTIDGDIVSIFWNGEHVVEYYELTAKKKKFKVTYEPGKENRLILYAHNLGKIPPNTMAVGIKAGKKKRELKIKSDLGKCGAIQFKR